MKIRKIKIGIIGVGVVGDAIKTGFEAVGHKVSVHDLRLDTKINDVLDTEVCFLCVPTPPKEDGSCNTSIVESVIKELTDLDYSGIVCIKSTVPPGTTERMQEMFKNKKICFVPEFLRERAAVQDFMYNHDVCIVGAESEQIFKVLKTCHGSLPDKFIHLTEKEAEFCKYFNNVYNATLITFANSFYEICNSMDVSYSNVHRAMSQREHISDFYLDCSNELRGFGGMCLPKDTKALAHLSKMMKTNVEFFSDIIRENEKYKVTVFDGMRKE